MCSNNVANLSEERSDLTLLPVIIIQWPNHVFFHGKHKYCRVSPEQIPGCRLPCWHASMSSVQRALTVPQSPIAPQRYQIHRIYSLGYACPIILDKRFLYRKTFFVIWSWKLLTQFPASNDEKYRTMIEPNKWLFNINTSVIGWIREEGHTFAWYFVLFVIFILFASLATWYKWRCKLRWIISRQKWKGRIRDWFHPPPPLPGWQAINAKRSTSSVSL